MALKLRFPRVPWRKVGRGAAWALLFLVLTFLFAYATLPFDRIKAHFLRLAEAKLGMDITGKIEKHWFTGIRAENLRLTSRPKRGEKPEETVIDEATVRLAVLPLFLGRIRIDVTAQVAGGEISGSFTRRSDGIGVEATLQGIDLKSLPIVRRLLGHAVEGSASGKVDLFWARDLRASMGRADLDVAAVKVASFQVPIAQWGNQPFTVPDLGLGDLRAEIEIQDGAAVFKEFRFKNSPDLEAGVKGYATLGPSLNQTSLRAHLRFKFTDGFFQRNPKFRILDGLNDLKRAQARDGFYGFLVEGPIGVPTAIRRTPMPEPPPNLTPPKGGAPPAPVAGPRAGPAGPRRFGPPPGGAVGPGAPPRRFGPPGPAARPELEDLRRRLGR